MVENLVLVTESEDSGAPNAEEYSKEDDGAFNILEFVSFLPILFLI